MLLALEAVGGLRLLMLLFRSLREARDMALAERDRALATEQDHSTKYEQLMHE